MYSQVSIWFALIAPSVYAAKVVGICFVRMCVVFELVGISRIAILASREYHDA
jgi:hypothetical protein